MKIVIEIIKKNSTGWLSIERRSLKRKTKENATGVIYMFKPMRNIFIFGRGHQERNIDRKEKENEQSET